MENKKSISILKPVIIILLSLLILSTLIVNILFSRNDTPKIFGKYIHIVTEQEGIDMGNEVTAGAALIADDISKRTLNINTDVVLCKLNETDKVTVRMFYKVATDEETGEVRYYPETDIAQGVELSIGKENIVGICTKENLTLGAYLSFARNIKGIIALLIVPSIILVIMVIVALFRKRDEDEDEFNFYNYESPEAEPEKTAAPAKPLFNPEKDSIGSNELELKKMSIAENFSQKEVNPNSPYQKEKERTMQFKAQTSAETAFASKNIVGQSATAPIAESLRAEMLKRNAEAEKYSNELQKAPASDDNDNTLIMSTSDIPKAEAIKSHSATTAPSYTPKKQASPDIDDIIKNSSPSARRKEISAMSIDDLLNVIENEKKKL